MRAIILAAGVGSRLRPITLTMPKSLIKINNKPLIETQIEYLKELKIKDIVVVVGYLAEKFAYLKDKYDVKIVFNEFYDVYNNIYTMKLVVDKLADSYVIDADIFMSNNFLLHTPKTSLYFSGKKNTFKEWALKFDKQNRIYDIYDSNGLDYIMSGVSYWTKKDADLLSCKLKEKIQNNVQVWKNLYWDNIVKENLNNLDVKIQQITCDSWYEIDTIEEYEQLLSKYPNDRMEDE